MRFLYIFILLQSYKMSRISICPKKTLKFCFKAEFEFWLLSRSSLFLDFFVLSPIHRKHKYFFCSVCFIALIESWLQIFSWLPISEYKANIAKNRLYLVFFYYVYLLNKNFSSLIIPKKGLSILDCWHLKYSSQ